MQLLHSLPTPSQSLAITDGESAFLWSFIQGSIMIPETWNGLLKAYGFCERHSWIHLSVEMSFRDQYLLGPTILYEALVEKALRAISGSPRLGTFSVASRLRGAGACLLCNLNVTHASPGASPRPRLERGRDSRQLRTFASDLRPLWNSTVCAACKNEQSHGRGQIACRRHLVTETRMRKSVDLSSHRDVLHGIYDQVARYQKSFLAGGPDVSDRDRAALLTAVGWCGGWRPVLALLQSSE
jgi:hypothetical protein